MLELALRLKKTRGELLAATDSAELSEWRALFAVHAEEQKRNRDRMSSKDGEVIYHGVDDADDDDGDSD